jgi:hypothetical protein
MEGPTSCAKFGDTAHEVVGFEHDLLLAVAIAAPDEAVGIF